VDLQFYLENTRYASENLLRLVWEQKQEYARLLQEHEQVKEQRESCYAPVSHKGIGTTKEDLDVKIEELIMAKEIKVNSIQVLSGALLQIAKQGMSIVHGDFNNWPAGKEIQGNGQRVTLKEIIRHGRNQAMHFEEDLYEETKEFFDRLAVVAGDDALSARKHPGKNLAFQVVQFLHWNDYASYESDMLLMQ